MYHDTTHLRTDVLRQMRVKARNQEEALIAYLDFMAYAVRDFTPSEVWRDCFRERVPITSVRRAITDLTADGQLVKTGEMRDGPYGKPEGVWRRWHAKDAQGRLF